MPLNKLRVVQNLQFNHDDPTQFNGWRHLIFGCYNVHEIIQAVDDNRWQKIRCGLKGTTLEFKRQRLEQYVTNSKTWTGVVPWAVKVQVTNYVNALKRGGLIR
jgi:hypothetical protein